jgi:hypothetical protein
MQRLRFALGSLAFVSSLALAAAQGCATGSIIGGNDSGGTCASPNTQCGAKCANTSNDPDNCGTCGTVCTSSQVCSQGKCGASCGGAGTLCTPDGGKATCASLATDPKNCGSCGNACTGSQTCSGGKCAGGNACQTPTSACPAPDGGVLCVDTQTDNAHCGACTTTCLQGLETCTSGTCASTCTGGKTLCIPDGGTVDGGPTAHCADLQIDNTDCGSCFAPCQGGAQCTAGKCVTTLLGSGTAQSPWHTATPLANCGAYHTSFPAATDGVYTTHPVATDIGVYCDMTHGGITFEDFGFGQYSATYTGYTICSASDFTGTSQFDAAFSYLYDRNSGLTNIKPGGWTDSNCCIENGTTTSSFLALAGSTYMYPAVNGVGDCTTSYSAATIQLQLETSGTVKTSFTATEAGQATSSSTCSTGGNPAIWVKKY